MPTQNVFPTLQNIGSIIAVSSCKGGVGKSTMAGFLACELAKRGLAIGLIDADIHGPSIPTLFDLKNVALQTTPDKRLIPVTRNNIKIMSFGFLLGDSPAVMRGPIVTRYIQQLLFNTQWGKLDYLLIDMPPGTGDVQLTITQFVRLHGAVIVTTPHTLSLIDVARGILMFEKVSVPILGIIHNMSFFLCDQCQKQHYIFGTDTEKTLKNRFGVEILAEIPLISHLHTPITSSVIPEIQQATDNLLKMLQQTKGISQKIPTVTSDEQNITLTWPDGTKTVVENRELRMQCRCALCINEMTGRKQLEGKKIPQDIKPVKTTPLGNYAIGIDWSDGHTSGIYPYTLIKEVAASRKPHSGVS